jgi:hypothetical protein
MIPVFPAATIRPRRTQIAIRQSLNLNHGQLSAFALFRLGRARLAVGLKRLATDFSTHVVAHHAAILGIDEVPTIERGPPRGPCHAGIHLIPEGGESKHQRPSRASVDLDALRHAAIGAEVPYHIVAHRFLEALGKHHELVAIAGPYPVILHAALGSGQKTQRLAGRLTDKPSRAPHVPVANTALV